MSDGSRANYEQRLERLRAVHANDQADAIVIADERNVRYLTGFTGDASVLIVSPDRALMVSDGRYTTQLAQECPGLEVHIRPVGQVLGVGVGETVARLGFRQVVFEATAVSVALLDLFKANAPEVEWGGAVGHVESLRVVKDAIEIAEIRESIGIAERAFRKVLSSLDLNSTEKQVADQLEHVLRQKGAKCAAFPPIVAVGEHSALPHAQPRDTARIRDSDFVLIDWGASARPYHSDLTRMVVTGKVTPELEGVYRTVLAAQERAIASIRPGVSADSVDAEARSVIHDEGFGDFFTHGLGHGFGLQIHEAPWLRRDNTSKLEAGMVVTIEPGIYLPGWGGVRIEDDILVTPDGSEVLSRLPRTLESSIHRLIRD